MDGLVDLARDGIRQLFAFQQAVLASVQA